MVWYSQLFQNFPQFIVIHTVKSFGIGSKAEIPSQVGADPQAHLYPKSLLLKDTLIFGKLMGSWWAKKLQVRYG